MQYRRSFTPGGCYFFTLVLQDRRQDWLVRHIDKLRQAVKVVKQKHPFEMIAVCVLPEHLHLLIRLPENDSDYPMRLRMIKAGFSRALPKTEDISAARRRKNERGIWQRRYWEHQIRDERDLNAHIDYIHFNPVKHGYVTRVADWPYSSFHRYVQRGILPADWVGSSVETEGDFGE
ncbi:REP-associated tyrosine transposase [Neisseria shayeganii]|uniref:Transposase n=1 Tax=Neisseria shayeganii 871 TaxID=1032488 RepID=G4CJB3_9NEIS|nr:transposase [Neisseria shayeganii]EGY52073.1 transposase [Neisseria shayeganii 871]